MKKHRIYALLTVLFLSISTLCGCSLEKPYKIKNEIKNCFPNCDIVSVNEQEESIEYTINNNGLTFTLTNSLVGNNMFGFETSGFSTTFLSELFKATEVSDFLEANNIERDIDNLTIRIERFEDLEKAYDIIEDFYNLIYDYLPVKKFHNKIIQVYVNDAKASSGYITHISFSHQEDIDWNYVYKCALVDAKDNCNAELYSDYKGIDNIPQKQIDSLYINGELFTSEKYETNFIYSVKDNTYYTEVGYGIKLDYNGGVEDNIQREIINEYYPNCDYKITSNTTSYKINNNYYEVLRSSDHQLTFYKNHSIIDIKYYSSIDGLGTAPYFKFISAKDFAELMEMEVEYIDNSGVHLKSK